MDVRISVIIPIYNVERYIRECLQSVARQSFSAYEVLMVDDGSTDRSGRIAQEYADRYSRFRLIHKENGGLSSRQELLSASPMHLFSLLVIKKET